MNAIVSPKSDRGQNLPSYLNEIIVASQVAWPIYLDDMRRLV